MFNVAASKPPSRSGRINPLWALLTAAAAVALMLIASLSKLTTPSTDHAANLRLYCAAGMRVPVEEIVARYREEYGVNVEIQYGGSNTLLNQLQVNRASDADLYLAADDAYTAKAIELELAADALPIAYTVPVLAVPRDNPRQVKSLNDLLEPGLRIGMADPDQAAVGKAVRDSLQQAPSDDGPLWDALLPRITADGVFKPTVNEVANDLKLAAVDAGFVWDSTLAMPQYKDHLEQVPVPELTSQPNQISIAVLASSASRSAAYRFARYLTARDRGLEVFREFGVQPVDGDRWDQSPELTFFCGAVNRRIVTQVIDQFQRDEGVRVNTVYDGCGILTSRMTTIDQQRPDLGFPDLYMACDRYYLDLEQVRHWFQEAADVSEADLVLVVPKGSNRVQSLTDLAKPGVRVAVGQPDQCTIGVLTWELLKDAGIADELRRKQSDTSEVVVEKSSSAHLVPDVVTGHVDAAIAYVTDTLGSRDQVDVISINLPDSKAVQPLSIARSSEHKYLARRLFRRIANARTAFESAGFRYLDAVTPHESPATASPGPPAPTKKAGP